MPKLAAKGKGKRYPLNMRTTKEVRDKLEKAAAASGRSLVGEVEQLVEGVFMREEEAFGEWLPLYKLLKRYLRMLAIIRNKEGKATADAFRIGLDTIVDAAFSGHLPDDKLKELQLEIIPELGRRGGNNAAGIACDALNVLSAVNLVELDVYKLSRWIKERESKRAR